MPKSKCCKATATVMCGEKAWSTNWYECGKCREACDLIAVEKREKREWEAWAIAFGDEQLSYRQFGKEFWNGIFVAEQDAKSVSKAYKSFNVIKVKITEVR